MKQLTERPIPTDWRYFDIASTDALRDQKVTRRDFAPASFRHPRPMKARTSTKLLIAVIGIAVFATVGVLAGFIER